MAFEDSDRGRREVQGIHRQCGVDLYQWEHRVAHAAANFQQRDRSVRLRQFGKHDVQIVAVFVEMVGVAFVEIVPIHMRLVFVLLPPKGRCRGSLRGEAAFRSVELLFVPHVFGPQQIRVVQNASVARGGARGGTGGGELGPRTESTYRWRW